MKNPVNEMPSHPDLDGMTRDEIEEYIEYSPLGTISDEVYDIGIDILYWERQPMLVGYSYGRNTLGGAVPIGKMRQQGKHYQFGSRRVYTGKKQRAGFRICRNKS